MNLFEFISKTIKIIRTLNMIVIQNWMFLNISCRATFSYLSKKTENIAFIWV